MKRGWAIRRAGFWDPATAADTVVLDAGDRHRRRIVLSGQSGAEFLLDLDEAVALRDGDGIMLDDGTIMLVTGRPESLAEVVPRTPLALVQLVWHLGNRHTDVQIVGNRIRIRRDHVLEEMAARLGANVTPIEAAFDPEQGAPQHHSHSHAHEHAHGD
jgi:urease accessory protein